MAHIPIGTRGEEKRLVTSENAISFLDMEGARVLSTPHMIGLMEFAAFEALKPFCEPGEVSVGTAINIEHRAPTVIGARVKAEAVLESVKGRFYTFRVTAHNGVEEIGRGTVSRAFIHPAKITERHAKSNQP